MDGTGKESVEKEAQGNQANQQYKTIWREDKLV